MNRWKASGAHFCLSIVLIGGIALTAFLLWYPDGLYRVAGLDRLLLVMLGIDLTAGPLLTLIVYKQGKRSLKFDLTVIALAQLAFLCYGLHTLWQSRPVFLVGTPETFTVVFASEIDNKDLAQATRPEWRRLAWNGPQLVGARMPDDPTQRSTVIAEFMAGGAGIERSPKYYRDYADVATRILAKSTPAPASTYSKGHGPLRKHPVISRRGEGLMLIDARSGVPVRTTASSPGR